MAEKSSRNGAVLALKPPVGPRLPARWEDSVATVAVAKWEGQLRTTDQRLDRNLDPIPAAAE